MTKGNNLLLYIMAFVGASLALVILNVGDKSAFSTYGLLVLTAVSAALLYMKKANKRHVAVGYISYFIVFTSLIFYVIPTGAISEQTGTILNANWWQGLNWIKENTAECATIATYWDPGHFISAIAKRPIVFGGTTQNSIVEVPYDGDKTGFEIIERDNGIKQLISYKDGFIVRPRIKDIGSVLMTANETFALELLSAYRNNCDEMYFLATGDLIGKSVWWTYFATWDPTAADPKGMQLSYAFLSQARRLPIQSLGIIGFEYPAGGDQSIVLCQNNGTIATCTDSIIGMFKSGNQFVRLSRLIYPVEDGLRVIEDQSGEVTGTVFVPDPSGNQIIYMPEQIENSLFTRMFLFNGLRLEKFQLVGNWGNEVKLYRVLFDE